jgi:transposase-like protein
LRRGLKPIYHADDAQAAERELHVLDESVWGREYPAIAAS